MWLSQSSVGRNICCDITTFHELSLNSFFADLSMACCPRALIKMYLTYLDTSLHYLFTSSLIDLNSEEILKTVMFQNLIIVYF